MVKNTQKNVARQINKSQATDTSKGAVGTTVPTEETAAVIGQAPKGVTSHDVFTERSAEMSRRAALKMSLLGSVRQKLAHAQELMLEGGDKEAEATEIAAASAFDLYRARVENILDKAELSAVLGDVYGYKPKKDGTPGQTPAGQGEAIRKRVVRLVAGSDYVSGGDGGAFYEGLPVEDVEDELSRVDSKSVSIWQAYDNLGDLRKEHNDRVPPAFNPTAIMKIVGDISTDTGRKAVLANDALIEAYASLVATLRAIGSANAK